MTATAAEIERLRRMAAEPDSTGGYADYVLREMIERYATLDAAGLAPGDGGWSATYDLNAAAAEVWGEKAAALSAAFDFTADGGTFSRSQAHAQALKMQRHYAARRVPGTVRLVRPPETDALEWE